MEAEVGFPRFYALFCVQIHVTPWELYTLIAHDQAKWRIPPRRANSTAPLGIGQQIKLIELITIKCANPTYPRNSEASLHCFGFDQHHNRQEILKML